MNANVVDTIASPSAAAHASGAIAASACANGTNGASAIAAMRSVPAEFPIGLASLRCTFVKTIV